MNHKTPLQTQRGFRFFGGRNDHPKVYEQPSLFPLDFGISDTSITADYSEEFLSVLCVGTEDRVALPLLAVKCFIKEGKIGTVNAVSRSIFSDFPVVDLIGPTNSLVAVNHFSGIEVNFVGEWEVLAVL